ncbi:MAG: barstar family protein [Clostridia bacterium]|nr:barstar family protein [Clostridia bacterium]
MILDGKAISGRMELHSALKAGLGLPDHYGRNLDALNDCLSELEEHPDVQIVHMDALRDSIGKYADRLIEVFERNGFAITYIDENTESVYNEDSQ